MHLDIRCHIVVQCGSSYTLRLSRAGVCSQVCSVTGVCFYSGYGCFKSEVTDGNKGRSWSFQFAFKYHRVPVCWAVMWILCRTVGMFCGLVYVATSSVQLN